MKNLVILAGMLISITTSAQNHTSSEIKITVPQFQSSMYESLNDFLSSCTEFPGASASCRQQGTEVIKFKVTPDGDLDDFTIINSICPEIDEEVIRVLESTSGRWNPGIVNGEKAAMEREISITFKMHASVDFVEMAKSYLKRGNRMLFVKRKPRQAIKYFDRGINLLPNEEALLSARGLCRYELSDKDGANSDWVRLKELRSNNQNTSEIEYIADQMEELSGYSEMNRLIGR
jgi:tetratricopeptide (TPR) repeat protein